MRRSTSHIATGDEDIARDSCFPSCVDYTLDPSRPSVSHHRTRTTGHPLALEWQEPAGIQRQRMSMSSSLEKQARCKEVTSGYTTSPPDTRQASHTKTLCARARASHAWLHPTTSLLESSTLSPLTQRALVGMLLFFARGEEDNNAANPPAVKTLSRPPSPHLAIP